MVFLPLTAVELGGFNIYIYMDLRSSITRVHLDIASSHVIISLLGHRIIAKTIDGTVPILGYLFQESRRCTSSFRVSVRVKHQLLGRAIR